MLWQLTVYDQRSGLLNRDGAGSRLSYGSSILEPADGWLGMTRGLARKNGDGVDGQGLVGRAHGNDRRWLVFDGCHLQVGLGHGRSGDAERRADVEPVVLFTDTLFQRQKGFLIEECFCLDQVPSG